MDSALFVLGRHDAIAGHEGAFASAIHTPLGTFAVVDGAGHGQPWEHSRPFSAPAEDWLNRLEDARG